MHNPPVPVTPMAVRIFLLYMTSLTTIMRVSRMLRETKIERYGRPKSKTTDFQVFLSGCEVRWMNIMIPHKTGVAHEDVWLARRQ